ncbi:colicin E3/pyocin S6 family cytotoxin [Halodesulfovibrio sp.]|jgi:hypothetical protein|uniref:colicin E3/pyocin S6 family cytotoxin n=1 Tax=Halodesulfovibrio sp. TaxID=1912772 RepID=UPI0025D442EB|nr:colicin E3/pyocin S6 family cytotoxin [Halodesulfovibrio sp.]MCT4536030.1 colicin E3/pyocin S6 family cytotoxin [Halodesulfovibrio sp.]
MKFATLVVQYHFSCLQGVLMSYKLVPPRGLYNNDIPNIVRPFTAKRILQGEFTFSRTTIFGLRDYVSAFGNKEFQQQKLLRDIENGRVILLAMSSEFGTLGRNSTGTGQDEFDSAVARIKRSAKDRPLWGYTPEGDSVFSELAAGAYMGFMSAVAEEAQETVEFVSDLVGSTIYEHTGYKGAEATHKRTEKRIDNLIEELKHIDDLVEGVAHAVLHPVDTTAAIAVNVKKGYDTVSQKLADGNNYGAGFVLGTTAKHAADLLLDSPLENLKKLKKAKKVVKAIDPEKLALPDHKGRLGVGKHRVAKLAPAESPIWKKFHSYKGKTKSNGLKGKHQQFYEWDYTHGDIEVYDSKRRHLGSMDPLTGKMSKSPVPGRKI